MKRFLLLTLIFLASVSGLFADDFARNAAWLRIMESSEPDYRADILDTVFEDRNRYLRKTLFSELQESIYGNKYSHIPSDMLEKYQTILIRKLGILNDRASAENIHYIMVNTQNSTLKREAMEALGRIAAVQYGEEITDILRKANSRQYFLMESKLKKGAEDNAGNAYSAIEAIESMNLTDAFEPVFRAALCSYPDDSGVKSKAAMALDQITGDKPTPTLKKIAEKETDPYTFEKILELHGKSHASESEKSMLAAYILTKSVKEGYEPGKYTYTAIDVITKAEEPVPETDSAVEGILMGNYDKELKNRVINMAPSCVNGLKKLEMYLEEQIDLNMMGKGSAEQRDNILDAIRLLGDNGDRSCMYTLIKARQAGWPASITEAAVAAIEKILKK